MRMKRTRIKICGLTRAEDVAATLEAGADAIGFVLYEKSPRFVDLAQLGGLTAGLPPFVTPVLLFVNANPSWVEQALDVVPQALLQFHGDETAVDCERYARPYLRAARVDEQGLVYQGVGKPAVNLVQYAQEYATASALLLDRYSTAYGGTGKAFDWSLIPANAESRLVLSGGLDAANVGAGMALVRPWAVDVSSGVEATKGVKDAAKIQAFVQAVHVQDAAIA